MALMTKIGGLERLVMDAQGRRRSSEWETVSGRGFIREYRRTDAFRQQPEKDYEVPKL